MTGPDATNACMPPALRPSRGSRQSTTNRFAFLRSTPSHVAGYVIIAFDTLVNNIATAQRLEEFAIGQRQMMLRQESAWQNAKYHLSSPVLSPFSTNSGGFTFPQYAEVQFPEWQRLAEQGGYAVGLPHEDDYLESNARLVLGRVAERLVAEGAFKPLRLASPFMVGYGIHDQEEAILRIVNWQNWVSR